MRAVKPLRWVLVVLYIGYLVQVGLLMLFLPWSDAWPMLLLRLPPRLLGVLDSPALRGAISGLGLLHLLLLSFELGLARPGRRAPSPPSRSE